MVGVGRTVFEGDRLDEFKVHIIGVLRNGLNMAGVSAFIQQIIIGFVVILAVFVDQLRSRR